MKKGKSNIRRFYFLPVIFIITFLFISNEAYSQTEDPYSVLEVKTEIDEGKDQEVKILFEGERRKIVRLILRNNKRLGFHKVEEPILIQHISGSGEVIIQTEDVEEIIELSPGKTLTIEAGVLHDVIAKPVISILLIRFPDPVTKIKK